MGQSYEKSLNKRRSLKAMDWRLDGLYKNEANTIEHTKQNNKNYNFVVVSNASS